MITKEEFVKYINYFKIFDKGLERVSEALSGSKYGVPLWETDWGNAVGIMLDVFLDSHFTKVGVDWISYWLFEEGEDKAVYIKQDKDMFNEEKEIRYPLNTIDDLWNFLLTDIKTYFKNAE